MCRVVFLCDHVSAYELAMGLEWATFFEVGCVVFPTLIFVQYSFFFSVVFFFRINRLFNVLGDWQLRREIGRASRGERGESSVGA